VKDIYSAMKMGATLVVIPKAYFMFPNSVVDMQPVQQAECRHRPDQRRDMVLIEHVHNGVWTEITCNCTYHILDRAYSEDEKLPIGIPFPNERVFLLDEEKSFRPAK